MGVQFDLFWLEAGAVIMSIFAIAVYLLGRFKKTRKLQRDIETLKRYLTEGTKVYIVDKQLPGDENIIKEVFDFDTDREELKDILIGKVSNKIIRADWSDATKSRLVAEQAPC